jgi:hypothetical protein
MGKDSSPMRFPRLFLTLGMGLLAASCGALGTPAPTQGEQCRAWGYAPDDPECLKVFRRYAP